MCNEGHFFDVSGTQISDILSQNAEFKIITPRRVYLSTLNLKLYIALIIVGKVMKSSTLSNVSDFTGVGVFVDSLI